MNKKLLGVGVGIVVLLIAIGIWVGAVIVKSNADDPAGPSGYTAVYMTSGDIYFGKMHWLPAPHLTDVWYIQRNIGANATSSPLSVAPFKNVFWGPVDELNINPANMIFWTSIAKNSPMIQALQTNQ